MGCVDCGRFDNVISISDYMASSGRIIKWERYVAAVIQFEVPSRNYPGGARGKHSKPQDIGVLPRTELGMPPMQANKRDRLLCPVRRLPYRGWNSGLSVGACLCLVSGVS